MAQGLFTPYSTVSGFTSIFPSWVPDLEKERIAAYQVYEEIYWNHPETFKLVVRGTENRPIYIPSGRVIVETMNRFYGKGIGLTVDPALGTAPEQEAARAAFLALFAREKWRTKFATSKRYSLIRGDMVFHVVADPAKPQGARISLHTVDPASYFPVYSDTNLNRIVKVHLVDQYTDLQNRSMISRQTYERLDSGLIQSSTTTMLQEEFAKGPEGKVDAISVPPFTLPPSITAIPVYHVKNFEEPGNPYGSSEMRGLEVLMAAINQSVSDEDIALALEGLGMYTTEGGGPIDDEGNEADWILGPGRVIENARDFKRVPGIGSVQPYTDHVGMIYDFMKQASGTPDIAIGRVDVQVAESGVALDLSMGPIMAKADEKEEIAGDVLNQMYYDLKAWLGAFEGIQLPNVLVYPTFGQRLPVNRKQEVDLAVSMVMSDPPIMSSATARERLAEKGIQFSADEFTRIVQEKQALAAATAPADPQGERMDQESGAPADASV